MHRLPARVAWFLVLAASGCAVQSTSPTVGQYLGWGRGKPPIAHCFDGVPHIKGSLPYVLGGVCVHSPTPETLAWYHRDGLLLDYDWERLKALYVQRGIKTIYDHKGCNNYCIWGPHVLKGGHCLVPPTPGTRNYEEVLSGWFRAPPAPKAEGPAAHRIVVARILDSRQSVTQIPFEEVN